MSRHHFNPVTPKVSLLIIRESSEAPLPELMLSIRSGDALQCEIVFVHIGSTDHQISAISLLYPYLSQIALPAGTEKEIALMEGIKIAKGEYLLYLNQIKELSPDFILTLLLAARKNKRIALISPKVCHSSAKEKCLYNGTLAPKGMMSYFDYSVYIPLKTQVQDQKQGYVRLPCKDAFLISMEFLQTLEERQKGAFFFLDEMDIALTIHSNRFKMYYQPDAVAYLEETQELSAQNLFLRTRNRIASIRKHRNGLALIAILLLFSFFTIPRHTFHHLSHLRLDLVLAFYRGVFWNMVHSIRAISLFSNLK